MSGLSEYLVQKHQAIALRNEKQSEATEVSPHILEAKVMAEGRSGIRRIRIRDFQIISDNGTDFED